MQHTVNTGIRRAYAGDAEAIARVINEAWRTAYAGIVPQSYLDRLDGIHRARLLVEGLARSASLRYYVFEEDGVCVGAASLHPTNDSDLNNTAEFTFFYFLPSVWRRGYGRQLLDHLKREAREAGFERLCCWVLEDNARAIAFYESQGMLRDGSRHVITVDAPLHTVRCVGLILKKSP